MWRASRCSPSLSRSLSPPAAGRPGPAGTPGRRCRRGTGWRGRGRPPPLQRSLLPSLEPEDAAPTPPGPSSEGGPAEAEVDGAAPTEGDGDGEGEGEAVLMEEDLIQQSLDDYDAGRYSPRLLTAHELPLDAHVLEPDEDLQRLQLSRQQLQVTGKGGAGGQGAGPVGPARGGAGDAGGGAGLAGGGAPPASFPGGSPWRQWGAAPFLLLHSCPPGL